ncbi:MAG: hypothetical protein JNN20_04915 [Betaproteobacteria bacterium]|nr:hypothetical protein [Betaproteobacteria bacterium]
MDFGTSMVAILAIVLGIGGPVAVVGLVLWYKSRKTRLIHETAIRLAEKGQPVPSELFIGAEEPTSDLRRGVVLVALGLGLGVFMAQIDKPWSVGLIPLFMGVGYILVWKLQPNGKNGKGTSA